MSIKKDIENIVFGGDFREKSFCYLDILKLIKVNKNYLQSTLWSLFKEGYLERLGRCHVEIDDHFGYPFIYRVSDNIDISMPEKSVGYFKNLILNGKWENGIFSTPMIRAQVGNYRYGWKLWNAIHKLLDEGKICFKGIGERRAFMFKLHPTRKEIKMGEKLMRDVMKEKLGGYEPVIKDVVREVVLNHDWPNGTFTGKEVGKIAGYERQKTSAPLENMVSEGLIEKIGNTGRNLAVFRIKK